MKDRWILTGSGEQVLRLDRLRTGGRPGETVSPVLTVQEICRRLRKSRRQVYRYLKAGTLQPCARILGQWLFAPEEADRFRKRIVPPSFRWLFWDVQLSGLATDRYRDFILTRVLEFGDRTAVGWALRRYPKEEVVAFLRSRGAEVLSQRAWHFWTSQFGVKSGKRTVPRWRRHGRHWGGFP